MSSFNSDHLSDHPRSHLLSIEQPFSSNKKKFGKNLNKLTKPPPPPPNASSSSTRRESSSKSGSNQGLLLLSTKRGSSSLNAAGGSSISPSSNLLSKLSGGTPALKSLLGPATLGADNMATSGWKTAPASSAPVIEATLSTNSTPWTLGVEKNLTDSLTVVEPSEKDQPHRISSPAVSERDELNHQQKDSSRLISLSVVFASEEKGDNLVQENDSKSNTVPVRETHHLDKTLEQSRDKSFDGAIDKKNDDLSETDVHQKRLLDGGSKVLKEATNEEEPKISTAERIRLQRRLKAFEDKQPTMPISLLSQPSTFLSSNRSSKKATSTTPQPTSVPTPILTPHVGKNSIASRNEKCIILEPLNRPKCGVGSKLSLGKNEEDGEDHQRNPAIAEIPENDVSCRTYSSLLGGSSSNKLTSETENVDHRKHVLEVKEERPPLSNMYLQKNLSGSSVRVSQQLYNSYEGHNFQQATPNENVEVEVAHSSVEPSQMSVIHLSSYDDQDRGERNRASSGPRMLFDPKSGSLVEARPRESRRVKEKMRDEKKSDTGDSGKGKVERKGKSSKVRNGSDHDKEKQLGQVKDDKDDVAQPLKRRESIGHSTQLSSIIEGDQIIFSKKQDRSELSRKKTELNRQTKASRGGRCTDDNFNGSFNTEKSNNIDLPQVSNKKSMLSQSKSSVNKTTPRKASEMLKKDEKIKEVAAGAVESNLVRAATDTKHTDKRNGQVTKKTVGKRGESIATRQPQQIGGLKNRRNDMQPKDRRANFQGKFAAKTNANGRMDASTKIPTQKFDDFNLDDDLLLDGNPDSPTLKATADAWRPSEAALRAAAAAAKSSMAADPSSSASKRTTNEDEDSESDIPFLGLGFDPTLNMDAVMMSPSLRSEVIDEDAVELSSLSLGPTSKSANPFSALSSPNQFLGSSTWGGGSLNTNVSSLGINWNNLLGTKQNESLSSSENQSSSAPVNKMSSTTFLSLSPLAPNPDGKTTWGSGAFGGQLESLRSSVLRGFDSLEKK